MSILIFWNAIFTLISLKWLYAYKLKLTEIAARETFRLIRICFFNSFSDSSIFVRFSSPSLEIKNRSLNLLPAKEHFWFFKMKISDSSCNCLALFSRYFYLKVSIQFLGFKPDLYAAKLRSSLLCSIIVFFTSCCIFFLASCNSRMFFSAYVRSY